MCSVGNDGDELIECVSLFTNWLSPSPDMLSLGVSGV